MGCHAALGAEKAFIGDLLLAFGGAAALWWLFG
jgi:hypothetical protein